MLYQLQSDLQSKVIQNGRKLLKPNGKLIFVESTTAGYHDIKLRNLDVRICINQLLESGFSNQTIRCLPFSDAHNEELILFEVCK